MKKVGIILGCLALVALAWSIFMRTEKSPINKDGKIIIGVPNWPSVKAKAHIVKAVIEANFGLEVELQTASNVVIFEAMDKSAMHLHPETWSPNHDSFIHKYINEENKIKESTAKKTLAWQKICITEGTAERTKIEHLTELTNPQMAKQFDSDGDGRGEIWIGAVGWGSTPVERIRAKSYGYDVTMKLKTMEEALAIAAVDAAVSKKQNIVFFCYYPHHIFTLYRLRTLKEPPHDPARWKVIAPTNDPNWLEKSHADMAWKDAQVSSHYSTSLEKSHPQVAKLFSRLGFTAEDAVDMSYQLTVKNVLPSGYAQMWIKKNTRLVDSWLR